MHRSFKQLTITVVVKGPKICTPPRKLHKALNGAWILELPSVEGKGFGIWD